MRLGAIPDPSYEDTGVRLDGVVPGSPAEIVGLVKGDIVVAMDDLTIGNLSDLSNALKTMKPDQAVEIIFVRNGKELSTTATLKKR